MPVHGGRQTEATAGAPSASSRVLKLLASQRSVVSYPGSEFTTILGRLAFLEQHVLLEFAETEKGRPFGCLLFQKGAVVYAEHGPHRGGAAIENLQPLIDASVLRLFALAPATAALAFAAVDGFPAETGTDGGNLKDRLAQLSQRRFSGVVASGTRTNLTVWHYLQGELQSSQELQEVSGFTGFIQFIWPERELTRFHDVRRKHWADQTPAARTVYRVEDDAATWNLFQSVLHTHLGDASGRLFNLLQNKYGTHRGTELQQALGLQVDRVAGRRAGLEFREQAR